MYLLYLCLLFFAFLLSSFALNQEGFCLLQVKASLFDPDNALASWNPSDDPSPCNWRGVSCDSATGSVTVIDLPSSNLAGPFPSFLCQLQNLSFINFHNNKISSTIPSNISKCENLVHLDLSRNLLTGEVPHSLADLRNLKYLDLNGNNLSGDFPKSFGRTHKLEDLLLSQNRLNEHKQSHKDYVWLSGIIFAFSVLVFVVGMVCFYLKYRSNKKARAIDVSKWTFMSFRKLGFSEYEIFDCLDEDNVIGRGSSGKVYKVVLSNGEAVAVKKLWGGVKKGCGSVDLEKGEVQDGAFQAEVEALGKIRHKNIVKLWSCFTTSDCKFLVYEYMPNGSLGDLLHGSKAGLVGWPTRLKIIANAAEGLSYLHHDCVPPIVHRDVKSNNILLDADSGAIVADFGFAKVVDAAGSYGYIAPEYASTLRLNERSDIYSFGVLILELVTGRLPIDPEFGEEGLVKWVSTTLDKKGVDHVLDSKLNPCFKGEICKVLNIGLLCTSPLPMNRPSMRRVVKMLQEAGAENQPKAATKDGKLTPYASDQGSAA